jgi:hypothetical protein
MKLQRAGVYEAAALAAALAFVLLNLPAEVAAAAIGQGALAALAPAPPVGPARHDAANFEVFLRPPLPAILAPLHAPSFSTGRSVRQYTVRRGREKEKTPPAPAGFSS